MIAMFMVLVAGCSPNATDAYNSDGDFSASDIKGAYKKVNSGFTLRISGLSALADVSKTVIATGTAVPSLAVGGTVMTEVAYLDGGYWNAYK